MCLKTNRDTFQNPKYMEYNQQSLENPNTTIFSKFMPAIYTSFEQAETTAFEYNQQHNVTEKNLNTAMFFKFVPVIYFF